MAEELYGLEIVVEPKPKEMVTITKDEYDDLKEQADWLTCLESAGVDNWDGYQFAREIQQESLK